VNIDFFKESKDFVRIVHLHHAQSLRGGEMQSRDERNPACNVEMARLGAVGLGIYDRTDSNQGHSRVCVFPIVPNL
jgi:hypothetical protein